MLNSHKYTQSLTAIAANANAAAMSLLQVVEQYLGSINTWPASITFSLFAETPSPRVVEYLTEFFAGNALPKTLAYRLYSACYPEAANELCASYSTRDFPYGTPPTPSDVTPCIMMYV